MAMGTSNTNWMAATCDWLRLASHAASTDAWSAPLAAASEDELAGLLDVLLAGFEQLDASPQRWRILMQAVAARMLAQRAAIADPPLAQIDPHTLASLYDRLLDVEPTAAAHVLQILSAQRDEESLMALASLLSDSPPQQWQQVAVGLSPLWNATTEPLELFFDQLEDAVLQPSTLCVLLDLANYALRHGRLQQHPWQLRCSELTSLLNNLVGRLRVLEREPSKFGSDVGEVQRVLADSVALCVSLCDALGQIGQADAAASLEHAGQLSHRRIQTEAAGALARLQVAQGRQRLIDLAHDPVARLRAVSYAEELGFADQIDEQLRLPTALAESELASWLASGEQFGLAPNHLELIDTRTQFWPSYEEPQACYLFRYRYELPGGGLSNIGIAGPLTHAFHADLSGLPIDDIYAAFAGWQAEHEDIYEIPMTLLNAAQRREADRLLEYLRHAGMEVHEPLALTFFLGEVALLAVVERSGQRASAITDGLELLHHVLSPHSTALPPELLLAIYRGRKLLRTFN